MFSNISHLILTDKKRVADKYIKTKILTETDLFFEITPAGKKYSIAEVKTVLGEIKISNSKKRVFYLPSFEASSIEAQNAMLKILEEPPHGVMFILTATSASKLLPTIVSRTKIIKLIKNDPPPRNEKIFSSLTSYLKGKRLEDADFVGFTCKTAEDATALIDQMILFFREKIGEGVGPAKILKEGLRIRGLLENNNITPQMAVDHMLIFVCKVYNMKL